MRGCGRSKEVSFGHTLCLYGDLEFDADISASIQPDDAGFNVEDIQVTMSDDNSFVTLTVDQEESVRKIIEDKVLNGDFDDNA